MSSEFRVELVGEDEVPNIVAMIIPAFAQYSIETIKDNFDTPESIQAATQRHLRSVREHYEETGKLCAAKCVETESGKDMMVACAYWLIYDKPRTPEYAHKLNHLFTADWVTEEGGRREKARKAFKPVEETHIKWTIGRGHGDLLYMATDRAWRRRGAATAVVQWGIDRCKELGIPAYLEASPAGAPVYKRLGFEVVENIECDVDGEISRFPVMMWWPPGTKEEDKRPLRE